MTPPINTPLILTYKGERFIGQFSTIGEVLGHSHEIRDVCDLNKPQFFILSVHGWDVIEAPDAYSVLDLNLPDDRGISHG